jgi:RimJ/RimL family protein N-acetyltransferase
VEFTTRRVVADDWQEYRALRLEMLADTPIAYTELLENAERYTDEEWQERSSRGERPGNIRLVAIAENGRWIGSMGGYFEKQVGGPVLYGVYVVADFRGTDKGVTDALLTGIEHWAREEWPTLHLDVHEDNLRARAAYEKRGYVETGHTHPYDFDPTRNEIEMIKRLR